MDAVERWKPPRRSRVSAAGWPRECPAKALQLLRADHIFAAVTGKSRAGCHWGGYEDMRTAAERCLFLSEPMTAREYRTRYEPGTLEHLTDPDAVLKEETERAALIAIQRGLKPSPSGTYPLVVWSLVAARH
jgi:hypothetical protein